MNNKLLSIVIVFISLSFSQDEQPFPPLDLVSVPTSGTLPKGVYALETLLMKDGGILPKFLLGVSDNFTFGVSFGVQNFIGIGNVNKNKNYPEVHIKYRLYEETESRPGLALGMNTQGRGAYHPLKERYDQKALGVYCIISRNWNLLGNFGFHIGLNKNLIEKKDQDTNIFFGFDKEINRSFSILAEYNLARDDDGEQNTEGFFIREGKGYCNLGLRWSAVDNVMLEVNVNDLLKNNSNDNSMNREVKIIYYEQF